MADQDYALLVGISRYKDGNQFPPLDGPLNDVERIREWLEDKVHGQAVPGDHIKTLTTPQDLLKPPLEGWPPQTVWAPNRDGFSKMFNGIAFDDAGKMLRREGRIYLYFSGHGFSLNDDGSPSAALFSADNCGLIHSNLAGTIYAAAVKRAKLFKEVVLIMDCCRDVFGNLAYSEPDFNRVENTSSDTVRLYALYAAPRRGKSQERELPDSGGKVVGLMTDAMLRALKEAPSDVTGQIAGRVLTQVMAFNWTDWYQVRPMPPAPRGVPPDEGDVYFNSRQEDLVSVTVSSSKPLIPGSRFELRSDAWTAVATVKQSSLRWRDKGYSWSQEIPLTQASEMSQQFTVVLPPGPHVLNTGAGTHSFDPGASNAVAI